MITDLGYLRLGSLNEFPPKQVNQLFAKFSKAFSITLYRNTTKVVCCYWEYI